MSQGKFVSVLLSYGNHRDEVIRDFLSRGWSLKSEIPFSPNDPTKGNSGYLTFEAGSDAILPRTSYPNARLL